MNDESRQDRGILDPADWDAFRKLAHQAVDDAVNQARDVRETAVWRPLPPDSREAIRQALTPGGIGETAVYEIVRQHVLPYRMGNVHPRYWTRMAGSGFPLAALADFLASAMNSNVAGLESSGIEIEETVLDWLKGILGFPQSSSGVLTSGCSMAHLLALTVCRNESSGRDINEQGYDATGDRLTLYCSDQTHNSIDKAAAALGIGIRNVRKIPTNERFQIDLRILGEQIAQDRIDGFKPCCVIGNAGTLTTGAIDDLEGIADICDREGLWFHIDGAFGAFAMLSETLRGQLKGLHRAHSIAVDLHKWMQMPYDVGCVLIRDADAHRRAFTNDTSYLAATARGPAASKARFYELGLDLSRSSRALKVWMGVTAYGLDPFRRVIEANVRQASYVAERVKQEPSLELASEPNLNVVCFRVLGAGSDQDVDWLNTEIALSIQESGLALLQTIELRGRTVIRLGIVNHRSTLADFDLVIDEILRLADSMTAQ